MHKHQTESGKVSVIVPMLNARTFLPVTLPAILTACHKYSKTELILVDNGSTDGSVEFVREHAGDAARMFLCPGLTVAAMRNAGARASTGEFLSFIDVDCEVSPDYYETALRVLHTTDAAATGSRYALPETPHWTESVWDRMHRNLEDGYVSTLNGGNLFVRASAFWAVDGFRESLVSGEDPDLCTRLREAGFAIYEDHKVRVIHHGNPKTLHGFFRKEIWRGLGMISHGGISEKPAIMTFMHLAASLAGIAAISTPLMSFGASVGLAAILQISVPGATVTYRAFTNGRKQPPAAGVVLYWVYYNARITGVFLNILSALTDRVPDLGRLAWKTASKG